MAAATIACAVRPVRPQFFSAALIFSAFAASTAGSSIFDAVWLDGHALEARHDMEMQVEHRLAARRLVELVDGDAVGIECDLDRLRQLLDGHDQPLQVLGIGVEHVARRRLGDDQRVTVGGRHHVHDGDRRVVLIELVRRQFAAQDFCKDVVRIVRGLGRSCLGGESGVANS